MSILSKTEYLDQVNSLFPDQNTQAISPSDLRTMFIDLGDSVNSLLSGVNLYSNNFREENPGLNPENSRTIVIGQDNFDKLFFTGRNSVNNIAIGYDLLKENYDGGNNIAIGFNTLECNLYGNWNIGIGTATLSSNIQGESNVAIGSYALSDNKHGNFNVALGYGAGFYIAENDDYKLFIGAHPNATSGCQTQYDDGPNPLIYGEMDNLRVGIGVKHLDSYGVLQTSGDITPSVDYQFNIGNSNRNWNSINETVYFSGGKIGIGTNSPSGDSGLMTVDGNIVPKNNNIYSLGATDLLWDGYFNDILVSGRAVINDIEYNTLTECIYECTTLHLGSSGLCSDGDWSQASKVCGYLNDAGIDGAGFIAHSSGASYIRDYSWIFRSAEIDIDCLEEDSVYSRSHWESNVSIRTLPGRHVATDRILGDGKLSLVKQSGCHGIFLTTNSPDKVHVGYERDLDANLAYLSGVDVSFLGDSGVNDNYIVSFASNQSGIDVGTKYSSRVSEEPHGFGFIYHDHKDELGYTNQIKDRFSLHVYDSGNINPNLESLVVMRASGERGSGVVGITNVSYADGSDGFLPETILNIHAQSGADLRISSVGENESTIQILSNGNSPASGLEIAFNPSDNSSYFRTYNTLDQYTETIKIHHSNNSVEIVNGDLEILAGDLEVRDNISVGVEAHSIHDPLVIASTNINSGTIALKQQPSDPSVSSNFGKIYVKENVLGGQTQSLYFMDDGGNVHNMFLSQDDPQDGLIYSDEKGNTFGGITPNARPITQTAYYNTAFGYESLNDIETGDYNTTLGYYAGNENRYGSRNTYLGYGTFRNVEGSYNTIIGYNNNVSGNFNHNISIGTSLVTQTGDYLLQVGVGTPTISGLIGSDKRVYINANEFQVDNGFVYIKDSYLKISHDDFDNDVLEINHSTSGGRSIADINLIDNSNNDRVDSFIAFNFIDGDGDSRLLLHLDHQADPMTNSPDYDLPATARPYAKLDGDLLLRGAIRFADGYSLESSSGIVSEGGTGIRYEYNESQGSGSLHLDFTDLFDVIETGLLDRHNSYLPIEIESGVENIVSKISIDTLGDYISSGIPTPSMVVENCNIMIANNTPLIQEQLNSGSVFIGCDVGLYATGWLNTVMIGTQAGAYARTPNPNLSVDTASIFLGYRAGYNADNLENGLFIGNNAGYWSSGASDSVFIGQNAGAFNSYSNSLGLGNNALRGKQDNQEEFGENNIEIITGLDYWESKLYGRDVSNKLNIQNVIAGDTSDQKISIGDAVLSPEAPLSVRKDSNIQAHEETPSGFIQTWVCNDDVFWGISCSGDGDLWHLRSGSGILSGINTLAETINGLSSSTLSFDISDGLSTALTINNGDSIFVSGDKGVEVNRNSNNFVVTADGLSGILHGLIDASGNAISGWAQPTFNDLSNRIDASGNAISGWVQPTFNDLSNRIDASGNAISGWAQPTFDDLFYRIDASGTWLKSYIDGSGSAISGWAAATFGTGSSSLTVKESDGSPSISNVQIINFSNGTVTDNGNGEVTVTNSTGSSSYSFDVSDGKSPLLNVGNGDDIFVSGDKGVEVNLDNNNLVVTADGLSGVLHSLIDASGNAISGWAQPTFNDLSNRIDASGNAISGWAQPTFDDLLHRIDASGNAISGWVQPTFDDLFHRIDASGNAISGWAQPTFDDLFYRIDASGNAISGWAQPTFNDLSNRIDTSGNAISGWVESIRLTVSELDEVPLTNPVNEIKFPNNSVSDNFDGSVSITFPSFTQFSFGVSDGLTAADTVAPNDTVYISGVSGIDVGYNSTDNKFTVQSKLGSGLTIVDEVIQPRLGSGLTLADNKIQTDGFASFDKVILTHDNYTFSTSDLPKKSGQLVADSGDSTFQPNTIINSGGYLSLNHHYNDDSLLTARESFHSGSLVFGGAYARVNTGYGYSPPPMLEGFASGLAGTHGQAQYNIPNPVTYMTGSSGWLLVRDNNLQYDYNVPLINRDPSLAISGGDFVVATYINGEYRPIYISCSGCAD